MELADANVDIERLYTCEHIELAGGLPATNSASTTLSKASWVVVEVAMVSDTGQFQRRKA